MPTTDIKLVFGAGPIGQGKDFTDEETVYRLYEVLKRNGCDSLDTARLYSDSEEWIGKTRGGEQFTIDSKTPGGAITGGSNAAGILQHAEETVKRLGVKNVSVLCVTVHPIPT
jgi:aflatoxin B1 aldehyde reductase